jgi:hypothetical protein
MFPGRLLSCPDALNNFSALIAFSSGKIIENNPVSLS